MTLRVGCVTMDALDCARLARFWADALDWLIVHERDHAAYVAPRPGTGGEGSVPGLLLFHSPDRKTAKNRVHLDLRPDDQAAEVARLEGLGAQRVEIGQEGNQAWVVMADPEGNEFCVLAVR